MKYSKEQRIDIGRQVYTHELSRMEASQKYEVSDSSLDVYVSLYKLVSGIQTQNTRVAIRNKTDPIKSICVLESICHVG